MSGKDPIPGVQAYEGVRAANPPTVIIATRDPTTNDKKYSLGTLWVNKSTSKSWQLTSASAGTVTWSLLSASTLVDVTSTTQTLVTNTTYIADSSSLVTFTLPSTANQGDFISIVGNGAGGWQIAQNANQVIKQNSLTTTTGTGGSISSTNRYNSLTLKATVAGASTVWVIEDFSGSFTFV